MVQTLQRVEKSAAYPANSSSSLTTNGFEVTLPAVVEAIVREFPDPSELKVERERLKGFWFLHMKDGKLYQLRLQAGGPNVEGEPVQVRTSEHPWLLRSRLEDAIEEAMPMYAAIGRRPFTFLAQKAELIATASAAANVTHPLLGNFRITPKFSLSPKIYEPVDGETRIGVFVTIGMRYEINADLAELAKAGVELRGMYVIRRDPVPGKKSLLGRVQSLEDGRVSLFDPTDEADYPLGEVKLEGSKDNYARCLTAILRHNYRHLLDAIDNEEAAYRVGPKFNTLVSRMGTFLSKNPLVLGQGATASVGERIVLSNSNEAQTVYAAPPVDYVFDRTGAKSALYAFKGLSQFGPFDRASFANKSPRILVVYPAAAQGKVDTFLGYFRDGMGAAHPAFPKGFGDLFGLVKLEFVRCPVEVTPGNKDGAAEAYVSSIQDKLAASEEVHAGIVILFDDHAHLHDSKNPYIHTKSLLLTLGIPTQQARMATIGRDPKGLQYILQNFAVSMYAKLNGTPWTVNHDKALNDELVVGMGIAELSGSRSETRQRFVGITTVFSGDGSYLLGNVSKECAYEDYPDAVRESMLSILREVRKRNNWRPGDAVRVVFHAHRPLKRVDVARIVFECTREVGSEQDIQMAFVTIAQDHPFYLLDPAQKGISVGRDGDRKGVNVPARGMIARLGRLTRLLCVNAPTLIKRPNSPLPAPLIVSLHPDSTFKDVDYLAEQALKFTSLSWRSTLPAATPVTIFYSERIAELLGRLRTVPDWSPAALNVKLKWSRWFL